MNQMTNKFLNDLPVCTTPAPGNWLLIETPSAAQKLDVAWLTSPTGAGSMLAAHLSVATDAHDASAISFAAAGSIAANNVQAAIEELNTDQTNAMNAHETAVDAHAAAAITFTPTATLTADNVQDALVALDTKVEAIVLRSPNGARWRLMVADSGEVRAVAV
jgi:hypothetical protein